MQFTRAIIGVVVSLACFGVFSQTAESEDALRQVDGLLKNGKFQQQVSNPLLMKPADGGRFAQKAINHKPKDEGYNKQARGLVSKIEEQVALEKERLAQNGGLDLVSEGRIAEETQKYRNAAKLIADTSHKRLGEIYQNEFGFTESQAAAFGQEFRNEYSTVRGVFISFSMDDADILEALKAAVRDGAQVFLNGLGEGHSGIQDTIRKLQDISINMDVKPDVRFQPKLFERFDVKSVPTIVYATEEKTVVARGLLNMTWLENRHDSGDETGVLGTFGTVYEVAEESIIETFRKGMAAYDWTGKKEKAIEAYWKKQGFNQLPRASEDETWYIDPTVKLQADVKNQRGEYLGHRGQVINAIKSSPIPLTVYAFNPTDTAQLQWAHSALQTDNSDGQVMLMFTEIDKERGWEHLASLRQHFGVELYKLPKELIKKFDVTAVPFKVTTLRDKRIFKVEQFMVGE